MSDNAVVDATGASDGERNTLLVAYVLFCATFITGFAGIAGVILCHIKIGESGSEFLRSHYRWLIRTFWFTLLWAVVCGVLVASIIFAIVGGVGFAVLFVWHLYRLIRGLIHFSERRPMPV